MKKVTELFTAIDVDIKEDDISVVHRRRRYIRCSSKRTEERKRASPGFSEFTSRRSKGVVMQRGRDLKEKEGCVSE